jgi:hypothetical protein
MFLFAFERIAPVYIPFQIAAENVLEGARTTHLFRSNQG